jgi:long-chain acyl-CoA synthetase
MLDQEDKKFMEISKFPYAIGYGLKETSPSLASSGPKITVPGTIGVVMPDVELKINNPDPKTGVGEIVSKGENLIHSYHKNLDLTKSVFTTSEDSAGECYFKTGDLGLFEIRHRKQYLFLKGRNK